MPDFLTVMGTLRLPVGFQCLDFVYLLINKAFLQVYLRFQHHGSSASLIFYLIFQVGYFFQVFNIRASILLLLVISQIRII
jgi:hypothetical protein